MLVTCLNVNAAHAGSAAHNEQHAGASDMPFSFRYVVEPRMHVLLASCWHCASSGAGDGVVVPTVAVVAVLQLAMKMESIDNNSGSAEKPCMARLIIAKDNT